MFGIKTHRASEYADWMQDNSVLRMTWAIEACPVIDARNLGEHRDRFITLLDATDQCHTPEDGTKISLNVYGSKYILFAHN